MIFTAKDFFDDLSDLIQRAADRLGGDDCRRALLAAYSQLHTVRDWTCYQRFGRMNLTGPYTAGTVAYDHTGGAVERQLTLTGGTWPDWAAYGSLHVGIERYLATTRVSNTVLQLDSNENPGADFAATAYSLSRERYPLPVDFQTNGSVVSSDGRDLTQISVSEWLEFQTLTGPRYGGPFRYTTIGDPAVRGGLLMLFDPSPGNVIGIAYKWQRKPRPINIIAYDLGKAQTTLAAAAVVGTGTTWTAAMVGSIFRLSGDPKTPPTDTGGSNPALLEATITAVADSTHLTLDTVSPVATNQGNYLISDPCDYTPGPMTEALKKMGAMLLLAKRRDIKSNRNSKAEYDEALALAKAADCVTPAGGTLTARRRSW